MATYRFWAARLVWHRTDSDVRQNGDVPTPYMAFDLACFVAHCLAHDGTRCNWTSDHGVLHAINHSYDLRPAPAHRRVDTREAAVKVFGGFANRGNHSIVANAEVHSSTGGSGGGWASSDEVVAFPLRFNETAVTQPIGDQTFTLYLEMDGGPVFSAVSSPAVFEVALDPAALTVEEADNGRWLVRLARTRSRIDRVDLRPLIAGDRMQILPLARHSEQPTSWVSPSLSSRDLQADGAEVRVFYRGETVALLGVERIGAVELQQRSATWDPVVELERRRKEVAAWPTDQRELAFFLDFDVQFHSHFVKAWRPLNAQELADPKAPWADWRRGRMELLANHAPSIVYARFESIYADEHQTRLKDYADLYGDDQGNVGPHAYRAHLDSLAQSQEAVLRQHFGARGRSALEYSALHRAFQRFAAGAYRTQLPDMAFRNGEPDSSFMFFWAEFAGEVVRWLGSAGSKDLTPAREALWARMEEILLDAVVVYARRYRPGGTPKWKDYSWKTFDPGVRLPPVEPGSAADFARWRKVLTDAFS
jgi:hypothetical protein